ncbi:MAG: histidinol dehydrogenase [Candidatus Pelagibacter sp.]|nr:histidinol dehydrogenase [Candidatus Pelagibacter sp.]|tara:strand:- start:291 stop:1547 length:1257 start_codon:yes stop_codon:yes gene_type:complete
MINILNLSKSRNLSKLISFLEKRRSGKNTDTTIVPIILRDIKKNKNKAVIKYEKKFNSNNKIKPTQGEIVSSIRELDNKTKIAIDMAFKRIYHFHKLQKTNNIKFIDKYKNKIEYKNIPINSVGIYIPANLPSSLLMNAIPAKICGVKNIYLANPRLKGKLNPAVMYVAKKCGIKNIITVGGAQAIGSLAYIQKVDKIIGPGNDFVARAKREVFGVVGTESMIAGPSEVTIISDRYANIKHVLSSMSAQSEHGINSQSILVTKDKILINKVKENIKDFISKLPRKSIIKKSFKMNGLLILSKNKKQIAEIINLISPEHLEIITKDYKFYESKIYNAGSIGLGKYSPVAASDYNVGTNHTLGTLGSAKFASGLNINEFYKKISQFTLTKKGIEVIGKQAITLAEYENLHAHSLSIKSRM